MKKVLIAGASGGIGKHLSTYLSEKKYSIVTLSRNPNKVKLVIPFAEKHLSWEDNLFNELDTIDSIINLSGASIGKTWTKTYKNEILFSRILTTRRIVEYLNNYTQKPIKLINASAIGYYPSSEETEFDERSEPGNSFLSKVCIEWEEEVKKLNPPHSFVICRFGVVLRKGDLLLKRLLLPFRFGFGIVIGTGHQWFSWIHIDDLVRALEKAISDENFTGIYNFVSPSPTRYYELTNSIGKILNKPFKLSIPDYLIKILFGEQSSFILASQKVIPRRLIQENFTFIYDTIEKAMKNLIHSTNRA
ncbi:MAG: TIGR01777 family oxidoreductase [Ignavibacteria bacterium]|nr:TIGR01777 family oxidoreductase [Ignavibacteria bacterium]